MKSLKELRKDMEQRFEPIEFSHADILRLHAAGVLMDGRSTTSKIYRKYFTPVALRLIQETPEYK